MEMLATTYKSIKISDEWLAFQKILTSMTAQGLLKPNSIKNFNRHLGILRKLTGR